MRHARRYGDDIDESSFLEHIVVFLLWAGVVIALCAVAPS